MTDVKVCKNAQGIYWIRDLEIDEPLRTPEGEVIRSTNLELIRFVAEYVQEYGEELVEGKSPYGLICSYLDFGFEERPDQKRKTLIETLVQDPVMTESYQAIRPILAKRIGWVGCVETYKHRIQALTPKQLCALIVYGAHYESMSIGYHVVIEGKQMPIEVARKWCNIYSHVRRFDFPGYAEKALKGAFLAYDLISEPDEPHPSMASCKACTAQCYVRDDACMLSRRMENLRKFAAMA